MFCLTRIKKYFLQKNKTQILDDQENEFNLSSVEFDINKKIFKSQNLEMIESDDAGRL